jgi:hypothetical protein
MVHSTSTVIRSLRSGRNSKIGALPTKTVTVVRSVAHSTTGLTLVPGDLYWSLTDTTRRCWAALRCRETGRGSSSPRPSKAGPSSGYCAPYQMSSEDTSAHKTARVLRSRLSKARHILFAALRLHRPQVIFFNNNLDALRFWNGHLTNSTVNLVEGKWKAS